MSSVIRTRLVKIGNSQGVRIPKVLIEQLQLTDTIELEVHDDQLIVRPGKLARAGWAAQFQQMAQSGDDHLLDPDVLPTSWDEGEWQMVVKRFEVFLVNLDPTIGVEIQKTRPCVIISPDEMNAFIQTVILAPMTTKGRTYPTRISCRFEERDAQIVLDQLRTVDKRRLIKRLGVIDSATQHVVLDILADMFAE